MKRDTVPYKVSFPILIIGLALMLFSRTIDPIFSTVIGVILVITSTWAIVERYRLVKEYKAQNIIFVTKSRLGKVDISSIKPVEIDGAKGYSVSCFIEGSSLLNRNVAQADLDILFPYAQKVLEEKLGMKLKFVYYSYASVYFEPV